MSNTAKIFMTGRSQAVRLPMEFRFDGTEVHIRRDPVTGDVILSARPDSWDGLFRLDSSTQVPSDYMGEADRRDTGVSRDPFEESAA